MSKPVAVIWPYRFPRFVGSKWEPMMQQIVNSLLINGYEVQKHPQFIAKLEGVDSYKAQRKCEVVIYNHAVLPEVIKGDVIQAKSYWFMKPTCPTEQHFTLDVLGYGPHSSVTFVKPPYEGLADVDVAQFYDTQVLQWVNGNDSKWGPVFDRVPVGEADYYLVIGQTARDYTTRGMYFGSYIEAMESAVREFISVTDRPVVVKLHPKEEEQYRLKMTSRLQAIDKRVAVYSGFQSIHSFLPKCRAVFLCNSTAGFEAMMHKKPIIAFGYPEYHWIGYDLRHLCGLHRALNLSWFNVASSCKYLCWYMTKYICYDQESTTRRVQELLNVSSIK